MTHADALKLAQVLRFGSPALPIGLYSYSQGTETAIDDGLVRNADTAKEWLQDVLHGPMARFELPLLADAVEALASDDFVALSLINERFLASRETREARAETEQLGYSLALLLRALPETPAAVHEWLAREKPLSSLASHALLARVVGLDKTSILTMYAASWLENQVSVLVKTVPLGQTAGQQILSALLPEMVLAVMAARDLPPARRSGFGPGLALMSMRHEHLYTRLFRS
jgi:urease accessory protein